MSDETTPLGGGNGRVVNGRYQLRGLLGQGGMADVELAYDQVLDRQVAVKILHQRYTHDPSFVDRFRREARASASMSHPNVVGVYDTGEEDGRPYIVMEYVAGRSLRDVLRTQTLTSQRAAEIAGDAARALHYAHERDLVHRDVKPGNIMVADDGQVKVTDFGIARAMNAETVTQTAAVLGTAAYVAPEQAQSERVDRRTDVYALGCVLYEMLTGRQPFTGDSAVALAYKHVSEPPVPPSQLNADISPELEAVVLKAMAKDPADRYQSAQEFYEDLQRSVGGMAVTAPLAGTAAFPATQALSRPQPPPPPAEPVAQEYWPEEQQRGNPAMVVLLVLLVLAGLGLAAFLFADSFRTEEEVAEVTVPDVRGEALTDAQRILREEGLQTELEAQQDPDVAANHVISTDPEAGALAREGDTVTIIYSEGPPLEEVPDLSGMPEAQARAALTERGFIVGGRSAEPSDDYEAGEVIRTDPAAGEEVPSGEAVSLVVSEGPTRLTLPSVRGLTLTDAANQLHTFCGNPPCVIVEEGPREFSDEVEKGRVISQDPEGETEVERGSRVTLIVSRGPEPEEEETPEPEPTDTASPTSSPSPTPTSSPTPTMTPNNSGQTLPSGAGTKGSAAP